MCHANDCDDPATHRVFWPGREPVQMCDAHRDWAVQVASAMSFYLHTEPYTPPQENGDG